MKSGKIGEVDACSCKFAR